MHKHSQTHCCPACEGTDLTEFYSLKSIPVQSCILLDTEKEACEFPHAELKLCFCGDCGFIFNRSFDLALVDYASTTEESQHFSGTFNRFAKDLVTEIAKLYDLEGKHTLEIGCGKGEFLQELVKRTKTIGLGIDPGFIPERLAGSADQEIRFQREYFTSKNVDISPNFVVCRHTLEHVPDVGNFINEIATVIGDRTGTGIFFETPDVHRVLSEGAFWDIYYEHCSYFTMGSHARLFRRFNIDVTNIYLAYGSQYIIQYAQPSFGSPLLEEEYDLEQLKDLVSFFPERVAKTRKYWTDFIKERHANGNSIAIWGGGSKCVSFLTTNGIGGEVAQIVDINPHKQGKFLPGTGHQVIAPQSLRADPPDTVIAMNPVYLTEIQRSLFDIGLSPELVAV